MKRLSIIVALLPLVLLTSCGGLTNTQRQTGPMYIKIYEEARKENFTNEQLRNYIKKNEHPAIVVRSMGSASSISSTSSTDRICSILEMGLAKNDFDVRDRSLFERVAGSKDGQSSSYTDLYNSTQVDLLMEITGYSLRDYYLVNGYYDASGNYYPFERINEGTKKEPKWITPRYTFRGMSITIKVILLKDNLVGGSYSYSYIPCSAESGGAMITQMYPLRYRTAAEARDLDAVMASGDGSSLMESGSDRLDKAMEEFITNVVVPAMMDDMKGIAAARPAEPVAEAAPTAENPRPVNEVPENVTKKTPVKANAKPDLETQAREICDKYNEAAITMTVANTSLYQSRKNTKAFMNYDAEAWKMALDMINASKQAEMDRKIDSFNAVPLTNSYGMISEAIVSLTDSKFNAMVDRTRSSLKKKKEIDAFEEKVAGITTDYDKLAYLDFESLAEINKFVSNTCSPTRLELPSDAGKVALFLPVLMEKENQEIVLYVFIDGNLYGAGTRNKGFYSSPDIFSSDNSFHELKIIGINEKNNTMTELYKSTVQFGIKGNYIFKRESARGSYKLTVE